MPGVFQYQDYRRFLADYYEEQKASGTNFSYRNFSRKAGFSSKSFVFNVINGKKNLSRASVVKMCAAMRLGKNEAAYFENLVYFNQAGNFTERNFYFEKLNAILPNTAAASRARKLRRDQYEFYATWYHAVVRSLIDLFPRVSNDYAALAGLVYPAIRPKQAQKSVELLLRLGLITKQTDGTYRISDKRLTTGEDVRSLAVQRFHAETMKLAAQAVKSLPKDKRNISGLTIGVSRPAYDKVRELMYDCQKKIMDVADNDEKADRVYQVNFHLFPVSKT
jgi:uncharacterized protein (TIGR02147 family)